MKLLFVTDLHGLTWKYEQLLRIALDTEVQVVINGGDLCPKNNSLFREQKKFLIEYLPSHFQAFENTGIYYLFCAGNDDLSVYDPLMVNKAGKYRFIYNIAQEKVEIMHHEFIGFNRVVDYPFQLKDRCRRDTVDFTFPEQLGSGLFSTPTGWEEIPDWYATARQFPTISEELERLIRPSNMAKCVYIIHMPPAGIGLDVCENGRPVGSKAVYAFLRKNQPLVSLHGHIHESPEISGVWKNKIGSTFCIQPGQDRNLTYVIADLNSMNFIRYKRQLTYQE
jgi:Icc-related predicted phosphoesterase